ncbi:hypothetical protein M0P28_04730 [Streptococcus pasteurianus]|nr:MULTISPECIES: hypothetical protein [Streptococcus]MCH1618623.1 hypothetical protein [Streptococcus gallolyticus]MCO7183510.1 hypothetical protein [Streptococcus gallolyticus]MDV5118111.1 hypothetical protein [Streptococcus pasteurianus]MDV5155952.1 hypothetical protein [Streptococcus pasteurianus]MDV5164813.1 hypothetical protein [Streptococcus pasteurianus]
MVNNISNRYSVFRTKGLRVKTIGVGLSIIALIIACMIIDSKTIEIYRYIYILPLLFAIINFLFLDIYNKLTIVTTIVIIMEFIRYVLTPAILLKEKYPRGLYTYVFNSSTMINTLLIMTIELVVIYFVLYKYRGYSDVSVNDDLLVNKMMSTKNYSILRVSSYAIILFTVILYGAFPAIRNSYSFIFSGELDSLTDNTLVAMKSIPSGVGWLGSICGEITRYILLEYILLRFFKNDCKKHKNRYVIISIVIIIANILIVSSSMVISLLASIVLLFQIYIFYPRYRKKFMILGIAVGGTGVIIIIYSYLQNVLMYHSLSQMIQDYTNGYYNIYQAQCAYDKCGLSIIEKIEMLFLGDGIANISPINIFFNVINSSDIFNNYLYGMKFNGGAVLPFCSQWTYYFTSIIGPFFSAVPIIYAKKIEKKWKNGDGNIVVLGMSSLVLALTPFMYNTPTLIHIVTMSIIPLWIASEMNARLVFRI